MPDTANPEAIAWLEDPARLAAQRDNEPDLYRLPADLPPQPHLCCDRCRPTTTTTSREAT